MGFALAEECYRRGAQVTLVAGPVSLSCSPGIERIDVESCDQMHAAATRVFPRCQAAVLSAAVADFKPARVSDVKINREGNGLHIDLQPTHDIAASLGGMKQPGQRLVCFALETNDEEQHARAKLKKKNADFIVLNSTRIPGTTFGTDDNQIAIISASGRRDYPKKSKTAVAADIVDELETLLQ